MKWIEVSSPGAIRRNRKTFKLDFKKLSLIITSDHIKFPENWILQCPQIGLTNVILRKDITDEAGAKFEAIKKLYETSKENAEITSVMLETAKELS